MAGTTMAELQELGAWKCGEMVRRYAHFAPEQFAGGGRQTGYIFVYTAEKRNAGINASY